MRDLRERGDLAGAETRALVERYTAPLLAHGADTLILGCTHYPFLAPLITEVVGANVALVDTGEAVARQLHHRLQAELPARKKIVRPEPVEGQNNSAQFFTSGDAAQTSCIMSMLWDQDIVVQRLPQEFMQ